MEFAIYYTLGAVACYFAADWILRKIETARGAPLPARNFVFFVILFLLALALMFLISSPPQHEVAGPPTTTPSPSPSPSP